MQLSGRMGNYMIISYFQLNSSLRKVYRSELYIIL
jgi:hypothetical protein